MGPLKFLVSSLCSVNFFKDNSQSNPSKELEFRRFKCRIFQLLCIIKKKRKSDFVVSLFPVKYKEAANGTKAFYQIPPNLNGLRVVFVVSSVAVAARHVNSPEFLLGASGNIYHHFVMAEPVSRAVCETDSAECVGVSEQQQQQEASL